MFKIMTDGIVLANGYITQADADAALKEAQAESRATAQKILDDAAEEALEARDFADGLTVESYELTG